MLDLEVLRNQMRSDHNELARLLLRTSAQRVNALFLPDLIVIIDVLRGELIARAFRTTARLTPAAEVAALVGLIERMKPQRVLEIGTFFGQTTRPMSEAVAKSGKLITIDPFGGHRVPDLLRQWPAELQAVTEFQPINSMEFFQSFETTAPDGKDGLDLVFIDGNHQFAYALFDITSAAINLKPGGVLVIDDVEQDDVRLAMVQFLAVNPAWQIVFNGRTWSASEITISDLRPSHPSKGLWAALFAPRDIQIGPTGRRFAGRTSGDTVLRGVGLNIARIDAPLSLTVTLAYSAFPFDYHLTGRGEKKAIRVTTVHLPIGKTNAEILFNEPVRLNDCENCNFFTRSILARREIMFCSRRMTLFA
jgi:predicted O-methyltransferase YrrM